MRSILVLEPGPLATVQDRGRFGFRALGVPLSGAMDLQALRVGNLLVGNRDVQAGVEITMGGFRTQFRCDTSFALSGAARAAYLNGDPIAFWQAHQAKDGDVLSIGDTSFAEAYKRRGGFPPAGAGLRIYLAISGGIDLPPVMGSRSTYLRGGFGGLGGRRLLPGDTLPVGRPVGKAGKKPAPAELIPRYSIEPVLRTIPGPQDDRVLDEGKSTFFSQLYEVTLRADRMGVALAGPPLKLTGGADIISDGTCPGAVQVDGNLQPTILAADCQTAGGYVKIATVISADLPLVAQLAPGDRVSFEEISLWQAREIYLRNEYLIRVLLE
ncbi:MAG: biotin-dependent carboxyltransferase family protein [Syntrophobacteraceae bacterium]